MFYETFNRITTNIILSCIGKQIDNISPFLLAFLFVRFAVSLFVIAFLLKADYNY